jgi:hypothetical protein
MTITKDTPISFLTVGQLQAALGLDDDQIAKQREKGAASSNAEQKRYVYGLRGIRQLFKPTRADHNHRRRQGDGVIQKL